MVKTIRKSLNLRALLLALVIVATFLRLWKLDTNPVSLFGDELDLGYQAYSILKTGKDYSGNSLPLHFQSLAEWRTPLYLYSAVPTVALFGISPLGVRLPAALFGILSIPLLYLLVKELTKSTKIAFLAATVLTFSPWHIQYSRAGFEVTELLFFLFLGLFCFFKSLKNGKWLSISVASFCTMPWIYSTAKLFTPFLMAFLFILYAKPILRLKKSYLIFAVLAGLIIGGPVLYSTLFGGGTERFNYISVFSDPTTEPEVGSARQRDARMRGEKGEGLVPTPLDKAFHNKFTFWGSTIVNNYIQALSFDFLFGEGDPNLRHSVKFVGQFYKIELIALIIGGIFFFSQSGDRKTKLLIAFWILAGIIPSSITRDGGRHATRLILILPPLVFLVGYGIAKMPKMAKLAYGAIFLLSFIFYQHAFWGHNPWDSERWWHAGWREAISAMKEVESQYDQVVITSGDEPPWIFFAGHYMYPPDKWQQGYPMKKHTLNGFGEVSYIDKYSFGSTGSGVYDWGKFLDNKTLFLASAKEVNVNLIMEPERSPKDLVLLKSIAYPSGEPAFYLFTGK